MLLAHLSRWLVRAFNDAELRRVVHFGPQGEGVAASLHVGCSLDDLAYQTVLAWDRHGVLDQKLLEYLAFHRPARRGEIDELVSTIKKMSLP